MIWLFVFFIGREIDDLPWHFRWGWGHGSTGISHCWQLPLRKTSKTVLIKQRLKKATDMPMLVLTSAVLNKKYPALHANGFDKSRFSVLWTMPQPVQTSFPVVESAVRKARRRWEKKRKDYNIGGCHGVHSNLICIHGMMEKTWLDGIQVSFLGEKLHLYEH